MKINALIYIDFSDRNTFDDKKHKMHYILRCGGGGGGGGGGGEEENELKL